MLRKFHTLSFVAVVMVLTASTTPVWALDWHDSEWTELGCPSKLSGNWVPLTNSPYAGLKIEFKPNGAALSSKENSRVLFAFSPNPNNAQYFNLKRVSTDQISFPKFLKIRPHIAFKNNSRWRETSICKIKLFFYESEEKADKQTYMSWDIYQRKP